MTTQPTPPETITELRRLSELATPGEWFWRKTANPYWNPASRSIGVMLSEVGDVSERVIMGEVSLSIHDAAFIEATRNALPGLLDDLERLQREKRAYEDQHQVDLWQIQKLREGLKIIADHEAKDVWYWQNDGSDHPESMTNGMTVVIRAEHLKAILANQPPHQPPESRE